MREKLIHEEKAGRSNLAVTWLDLLNACVSISLALIKITPSKYHIPEKIQSYTGKYFSFLCSSPSLREILKCLETIFKGKISVGGLL